MNNKTKYLGLIEELQQIDESDSILVIDALNLFFRNFSVINKVNSKGQHIGGIGGFLKSLGYLIKITNPNSIYVVFDGSLSSLNRKNLLPEYKEGRNTTKITNFSIFDTKDDEEESQISQIQRIIQYLKILPVKTLVLERSEADDIIAYMGGIFSGWKNTKTYLVSNDKDYIQLIKENVILFRPTEKQYYSPEKVKEIYGVLPENFILYKTLLGDGSDKIKGVKGLGHKKIFKFFPELQEKILSLDDMINISKDKVKDHKIYAYVVFYENDLRRNFKIMDLGNPMIDQSGINYIESEIKKPVKFLGYGIFNKMQKEDELDRVIRNPEQWIKQVISNINHN